MFLLLFRYVFGNILGAGAEIDYANYIVPGILLQTSLFAASNTAVGLADDMGTGAIDRFRTLPMARSALLTGCTIADTIRNTIVIGLLIGIGYLIGFSFQSGPIDALGAIGIALLFGWCFSWVGACVGLAIRDSEAAQSANMMWMFPLMFTSSVFVPTRTLPVVLRVIADVNPVTFGVDAVRSLSIGGSDVRGDVIGVLAWCVALCVIFIPLATHMYRRSS
jgi:ABC-2 type transport system permease protein/oleandomycin transport system permease protein